MKIILIFLLFVLVCACNKSNEVPKYSAHEDHTISKDGTMHKSGLKEPQTNCASCHGSDLKGGTVNVSCYDCHSKEW